MILGIGIDIIEIARIKKSIDEYGDRFLKKIFTQNEIAYCNSKFNKYQHFAARFAAKEAVYKAISSGWNESLSWMDIEIQNEPNGMPRVEPSGRLKKFLSGNRELKISISHSDNYVTSLAIVFNNNR